MPTDNTVPVRRETLRVPVMLRLPENLVREVDHLGVDMKLRRSGTVAYLLQRGLQAVREAEAALTAALDPEQNPSFALEIAERELRILTNYVQQTLKLAGCPCPVSLVGCPPDRGLRCRLCDVAALGGETAE